MDLPQLRGVDQAAHCDYDTLLGEMFGPRAADRRRAQAAQRAGIGGHGRNSGRSIPDEKRELG